jgi:hypothetical protein
LRGAFGGASMLTTKLLSATLRSRTAGSAKAPSAAIAPDTGREPPNSRRAVTVPARGAGPTVPRRRSGRSESVSYV